MAAPPETLSDAANGRSSFENKKWHEIWNPLMLDQTEMQRDSYGWAENGFENAWLFSYFMWCSISTVIGPVIPLLVLLGDPTGKFSDNVVYWFIVIVMLGCATGFTIHDFKRMRANKSMSYFKITLHLESKREHSEFRKAAVFLMFALAGYILLISYIDYEDKKCEEEFYSFYEGKNISVYDCNWSDYSQKKCTFYYSVPAGAENTTLKYKCNAKALNVSTDAPTYPSLNFFILMTFFFKSVYDFYFYNEIFADFMLPSARLVKEHFPDVHKFALENMPVRTRFDTERFEPNIPIRPVGQFTPNWKFWEWFIFTDSQVVIKNVLLACSRIQAYTNKHPMTESEKRLTVSQLSDHVKKLDNPALSDDSIAWEYVPLAF
jgi:hypothetical protein